MARLYCTSCNYLMQQCVCDLIPINSVIPDFNIVILQHEKESKHAKNTVKLLQLVWPFIHIMKTHDNNASIKLNCELEKMKEQGGLYLLYPTETSFQIEELTESTKSSIKNLILIDATWKKSLKLLNLYPILKTLPTLCFKYKKESIYTIRKSPNEMALSSFEAVVYSCGLLGGLPVTPMLHFMTDAQNRLWEQRP